MLISRRWNRVIGSTSHAAGSNVSIQFYHHYRLDVAEEGRCDSKEG
jgi:hypothetical protein